MQAYLQYRRIEHAVRRQLDDHPEWVQAGVQEPKDSPEATQGLNGGSPGIDTTQQSSPSRVITRPLLGIQTIEKADSNGNSQVFLVGWDDDEDPINPRNYSMATRISITMIVSTLGFIVGAASSIESGVLLQNSAAFHVSEVVASLATGLYLIGFGVGSLASGPLSEIFGRNAVYACSLSLFMIFIMASGLAPNIGAQLAFRFLAGVFGCPPLTCCGGTIADIWNPLEKTFGFPLYAVFSFGGPVLGPVISSYMGQGTLSWRWTNWIVLITSALVLALIILFLPETYPPLLLKWKARHLRHLTGDERYRSEMDLDRTALFSRIKTACVRQFSLTFREPIILLITLYMNVVYIVIFTFFVGYPYIFSDVYDISQGLTNIVWVAMYMGIALVGLFVPWVYFRTKREFLKAVTASPPAISSSSSGDVGDAGDAPRKTTHSARPENRLWYAMIGAPAIPIGLFWMGWTDYVSFII